MIDARRIGSLGELLDEAWSTWPADLAAVELDRDRERKRLTYAALRAASHDAAAWLARHGVGPNARVGVAMANQAAWLQIASAALHLGAVLVPLDARLSPPELLVLIRHAGLAALATDAHTARALGPLGIPVLTSGDGPLPEGAVDVDLLPPAAHRVPMAPRQRDDVATLVYSSGTGGNPKGCLLPHGAYLSQYQGLADTFDWRRGDRYLSILPTNHAIDFMCGYLASFATGGTVVHQRTLRPEHITATMRRWRVTQMAVVPMILEAFDRQIQTRLDELPREQRRVIDGLTDLNTALTRRGPLQGLSRWLLKPVHDAFGGHLRVLYCGGAFTPRSLSERFYRLGLPVAVGYGLTEACTVVSVNDLHPFRGDSVGAPVPGVEVRIAAPGPDGVGEVQVRGPTVFRGYLDDPEQTAASFDGDWLRTGDLGWMDAAFHLHLVGRRKNMIVTAGGKNVYPEDVEHAFAAVPCEELCVLAEHFVWPSASADATTIARDRLVLVVRPGAHDPLALRAAIARANRSLPEHQRIAGWLPWHAELPRTTSLKLKRHVLAEALRAGAHPDDLQGVTT